MGSVYLNRMIDWCGRGIIRLEISMQRMLTQHYGLAMFMIPNGGIKKFGSSNVHLKIKKLCGMPSIMIFQPRILYSIGIGRVLIDVHFINPIMNFPTVC